MIDTIKIFTMIDKKTCEEIESISTVRSSIDRRTGELHYELNSSKLVGSYSNTINIRTGEGATYGFKDKKYLSIEGSYHKLVNGYNSHNGYYNLQEIVRFFISAVSYDFQVELPSIKHWFLQRCDIAIVFDLNFNENVCKYINNLSLCSYPRRNMKFYPNESIYVSGTTTTLKIYNKMIEFRKHDMKKLFKYNFGIEGYLQEIDGFIRFECEIKKKKLQEIYKSDYIRVFNVCYDDLKSVWSDEFMKLLSFLKSDLTVVKNKDDVERRIFTYYAENLRGARALYTFYLSYMLDGKESVKKRTSKTTFYKSVNRLKALNIDLSQKFQLVDQSESIDFNPFEWQEVL